jgi:hypothetical protein
VVEFRTDGNVLVISIRRREAAVIRHFQRMPYGLFVLVSIRPERWLGECGRYSVCPKKISCHVRPSLVIEYRGQERVTELGLAPHIITKLALEAQFRNMSIGELIGALVTAMTEKNLFQLMLDTEGNAKAPPSLDMREIRVFRDQTKTPDRW